ncbi:glycine zipper family protein [Ferruginibacter sp.]
MKKALLMAAFITAMAACKNKSATDDKRDMVMTDTTGLYQNNASTDIGKDVVAVGVKQKTAVIRNYNAANTANNNSNTGTGGGGNNAAAAPVKQDKGWSDAAKGTAIGAGSGAILGAVVSKDKAKGAVIGAVLGAGTGYAIGRSRDKKSGRVARQKARRQAAKQ